MALRLAEQTSQSLRSADLLLESVTRDIGRRSPRDSAELRRRVATAETNETLRDRSAALPLVDIVAIVAPEGEQLTFSRALPLAEVEVGKRDYFQLLSQPGAPRSVVGQPLRSDVADNWLAFLARRFDNRAGGFGGLVVVGLSVPGISGFFARVGKELDSGATLSLLLQRRDFVLVARHPFDPAEIGKAMPPGSAAELVARQGSTQGS